MNFDIGLEEMLQPITIYAIFPEELLHYVIFSMLNVNYPLLNCVSKTLLKGIFVRRNYICYNPLPKRPQVDQNGVEK
jgi:hypothetical protein